jgi:hypothetical protein
MEGFVATAMRLQTALKAGNRLASWMPVSFSILSDSQLTIAAHSVSETWFAVDLDTERCFIFRNDILPMLIIRNKVAAHSIISWSRSERSVTNCYVLSVQLFRCLARCYFVSHTVNALSPSLPLSHIVTCWNLISMQRAACTYAIIWSLCNVPPARTQ